MRDRIPKKPNRYKMLHSATGIEEEVYIERDDDPAVEGTPLNTETLMSHKVARLYDLPIPDSTPSQALDRLADHVETIANPGFELHPESAYLPDGDKIVYVDDTGDDNADGSATAPYKTLKTAFAALGAEGGTVRILSSVTYAPWTVTDTYGTILIEGVTPEAKLTLGTSYPCCCNTSIRDITLDVTKDYTYINGMGYRLAILKGVKTQLSGDATVLPLIRGGGDDNTPKSTHIAVFSGDWRSVHGGTACTSTNPGNISGNTIVAIYGGNIDVVSGDHTITSDAMIGTIGRKIVIINGGNVSTAKGYDLIIRSSSGGYVSGDLLMHTGNVKIHMGHMYVGNGETVRHVHNLAYDITHKVVVGASDKPQRNLVVYAYGDIMCEQSEDAAIGDNYRITVYGGRLIGDDIPKVTEPCKKIEYRASVIDGQAGSDVILGTDVKKWVWTATPLDTSAPQRTRTICGAFGLGADSDGAVLVTDGIPELADVVIGDTICDTSSGCLFEVTEVGTASVTVSAIDRLPNERAFKLNLNIGQSGHIDITDTELTDIVIGDVVYDDNAFAVYRCVAVYKSTSDGTVTADFIKIMDLPNSRNTRLIGYRKRGYTPIADTDSINTAFGKVEGRLAELANAIFTQNNKLVYTISPDTSETFVPPFDGTYDIYAVGGGGNGEGVKGGGGGGVAVIQQYRLRKDTTYTVTRTETGIELSYIGADGNKFIVASATDGADATSSTVGAGGTATVCDVTSPATAATYVGTSGNGRDGGSVADALAATDGYVAGRVTDWYADKYRTLTYRGGAGLYGDMAGMPGYADIKHTGATLASSHTYYYHYNFTALSPADGGEGAGQSGACSVSKIKSQSWEGTEQEATLIKAVKYAEGYAGGIGGSGYGGGGSGAAASDGNAGCGARACVHIESYSLEVESTGNDNPGLAGDYITEQFDKMDSHIADTNNPHGVTPDQIGAVDNNVIGFMLSVKEDKFGGTPSVGQVPVIKTVNSDGSYTAEWSDIASGGGYKKIGYTDDCDYKVSASSGGKAAFEAAVADASVGDTIIVMMGTYSYSGSNKDLSVNKNLNFVGIGTPTISFNVLTTLDDVVVGENGYIESATTHSTSWDGFSFRGNFSVGCSDGADSSAQSTANAVNCMFYGNTLQFSGTYTNCVISTSSAISSGCYYGNGSEFFDCNITCTGLGSSGWDTFKSCDIRISKSSFSGENLNYGGASYDGCNLYLLGTGTINLENGHGGTSTMQNTTVYCSAELTFNGDNYMERTNCRKVTLTSF